MNAITFSLAHQTGLLRIIGNIRNRLIANALDSLFNHM